MHMYAPAPTMRATQPEKGLHCSPLSVLDILKCNNGIFGDAVCPGHSPERVDALRLCLANTKEYDIHLQPSKWVIIGLG